MFTDEPDQVNGSLDDYFAKKRKTQSQECLDLENTNETLTGREKSSTIDAKERNMRTIKEVLKMLNEGVPMGRIKSKLRLSDKTAFKMYRQWQKYK